MKFIHMLIIRPQGLVFWPIVAPRFDTCRIRGKKDLARKPQALFRSAGTIITTDFYWGRKLVWLKTTAQIGLFLGVVELHFGYHKQQDLKNDLNPIVCFLCSSWMCFRKFAGENSEHFDIFRSLTITVGRQAQSTNTVWRSRIYID